MGNHFLGKRMGLCAWGWLSFVPGFLYSSSLMADAAASDARSVRLECAADSAVGSAPCDHVKNYISTEFKNKIIEEISDYYRGFTSGAAGTRIHQTPVCNFAAGEGSELDWARGAQRINYGSLSRQAAGPDLRAAGAKNYNYLKSTPSNGMYSGQDISWCGSFCKFHVSTSIIPWRVSVTVTGDCGREYAYFRGLWPQSLWKQAETVTAELEAGEIHVTENSACQLFANDLNEQHLKLIENERIFTEKVMQERTRSAGYQIPHCRDVIEERRIRERSWNPSASEMTGLSVKMLDYGFSQPACMLQIARTDYYKAMIDLAHCEVTTRARAQIFPHMESRANENFMRQVKDKIVDVCASNDDENINNCYRREFALAMERNFGATNPEWRTQGAIPHSPIIPRHTVRSLNTEIAPTINDVKASLATQLDALRTAISAGGR